MILDRERATLDRLLPGLDDKLSGIPLADLERPGNEGLTAFRSAGGAGLLVPTEYGGLGASMRDAVRVQRAIGSRSPSLAIATTMHHFSVGSLVELAAARAGLEWAMLSAIAENRWLLSSGFAEGRSAQHILSPAMRAVRTDGGIRVTGEKKPCSLTWSMDLMSASVVVSDPAGGPDALGIILIPANSPGIERKAFWATPVLAGAESDHVVLRDVFVDDALTFYPQDGRAMDPIQSRGFVWFELLIAAAYLGMASGLLERVLAAGRGPAETRAALAAEVQAATGAVEHVAMLAPELAQDELLAAALFARFGAERTIERVAMGAASAAGGLAFVSSPDIGYLVSACRALSFHPPSLASAAQPLTAFLTGEPLVL